MPHGLVEERSVWCPVDLVSHHAERSNGALACALDSYCACPVYSQSRYTFGNRTFSSESSGPSDLHEGGLVSVQEICCEHLYLLLRSKLLMNSFHISILYRVQLHLWSTRQGRPRIRDKKIRRNTTTACVEILTDYAAMRFLTIDSPQHSFAKQIRGTW